jgi:uncharacterized protein YneF (UPF0154 family)
VKLLNEKMIKASFRGMGEIAVTRWQEMIALFCYTGLGPFYTQKCGNQKLKCSPPLHVDPLR